MAATMSHGAALHEAAWSAFAAQAAPAVAAFERSLAEPDAAQQRLLRSILMRNADTDYGRAHGFGTISNYAEFRGRVPITSWKDIAPWIERAQATLAPVLTAETPLFYERTSGSSAARKDLPYTPSLLDELRRALVVWLARLYAECPRVAGASYWALSPVTAPTARAPNGIPVGSASDADYLRGSAAEQLLPTVLDTRSAVRDPVEWRRATLLALILAADLRMLSVWSPTFATALLEPLLAPLRVGPRGGPARLARAAAAGGAAERSTARPRGRQLRSALARARGRELLGGRAERALALRLAAWLPQARLVPKGLFATEGVVSVPWGIAGLNPLAIESHLLEFSDSSARILPAHELVEGQRYEPLLTTSGGLYRYRLGDVVEVSGFLGATPCVRYCGRSDARCDLVGEKLDATLAADACAVIAHAARACVLVPMPDAGPPGYLLIVESSAPRDAAALAAAVEARLHADLPVRRGAAGEPACDARGGRRAEQRRGAHTRVGGARPPRRRFQARRAHCFAALRPGSATRARWQRAAMTNPVEDAAAITNGGIAPGSRPASSASTGTWRARRTSSSVRASMQPPSWGWA